MQKLNDMQRYVAARSWKKDKGAGRAVLRSMGYNCRPLKKNSDGLVNVFTRFDDKHGDSGVTYFIVDISGMKVGGLEYKIERILFENGWDVDEYRPNFDYDCSGVCMRNKPIIKKVGSDENRYIVKSRWFVDC